jgi:hypothetical protein
MELARFFESSPDYVFKVQGTRAELQTLEAQFPYNLTPSIIAGPRLVAFKDNGTTIMQQSFTFTDRKDAMLFRLSIP